MSTIGSAERKIGDIMVPVGNYLKVNADTGFREIVSVLRKSIDSAEEKSMSGGDTLLVYDNNLLAGFISLEEVLGAIEPQFLKGGTYRGWTISKEWAIPVFWEGLFTDRCIEATDKKAREIMQPVEFSVEQEDPLIKAVYGMTKHSAKNLPVLSDSLAVGVVRSRELFMEISALVSTSGAAVYSIEKSQSAAGRAAVK